MTLVYVLLIAHFIGDFLCQSDWMALNKSKRWDALAVHVGVYTLAASACLAPLWTQVSPLTVAMFWGVNAVAHFVQDAITSRITARLWFVDGVRHEHHGLSGWQGEAVVAYNNKRHWFFVAIGADQLLHYITLFVTAEWWLR